MAHDATKAIMGVVRGSNPDISMYNSDPATYLAGLAVRQSSTIDALTLLKTGGSWSGISLGKSLSDHKKTAVCRSGLGVPLLASLKRSTGVITIDTYANLLTTTPDSITVGATIFTAQSGAAALGDATFRAATSDDATAISLAAQINGHATAGALVRAVVTGTAVVTLYSKIEGAASGHDVALAYTDNGGGNVGAVLSGLSAGKLTGGSNTISDIAYIAKGAKVYINDFTGKADIAMSGYSTISDAVYTTLEMDGINESAATVAACYVDMPGGL